MTTKTPTKVSRQQPAKAAAKTPAKVAVVAAPVTLPPVADVMPVLTETSPVAAAVAVEAVVEVISDIREAVSSVSLKEKGNKMIETIKDMGKNLTAQGEKFTAELKTRSEDAVGKGKQLFTDWNDFNKGNVEAIVESGKIAAKGFEKLGQEQADYARKSFEQTTAAFKGMAAVKSPTDLAKLHSDYVRSSFDAMVAQTSHSTEAFLKLAGEIAQPLSNRFAVAAEKVKLAA